MSDNPLVPVGPTLFSRDALDAAVRSMIPELPEGRQHGIGFAVDLTGAQFAVLFGSKDGDWKAAGAVHVDYAGNISGSAAGSFTWD